jgi:hypothetical protein
MKRKDDPVRLKLRGDRERAFAWLDILCKGIGHALTEEPGRCGDGESVRILIGRVNGELLEAVTALEKAEKAYQPYWSRRRIHYVARKPKPPKTVKPEAAVVQ